LLRAADDAFAALGDRAGLATVLHLQGTLASQQSHYDEGRAAYEASLAIRQSLGDAPKIGALLSNLAVVAEQVGDYAEARELNERALAVRQEVGDPWAIAVSQNNLGMIALLQEDYPRATEHIAASMRLAEQVGDRWIVAVGQHNYGNAQRGRAEYAASGAAFLAAQQAYLDHDDRWSMALLVEDVIFLAVDTGQDREAVDLLGAADALRDALDAPRSPAPAALTDAALAPVRDRLGAAADIEYAAGRRLAAAELAELVRRVCSRPAA
jgi:tetratricopeptide (TPR) repeat protein